MRALERALWVLLCAVRTSAAQSSSAQFHVSGELRVRGELDARTAGATADAATLLRTRVGILATLDSGTRAFVQLSDSRAFGEEASTLDAAAKTLDFHQAYLDVALSKRARLRLGRQELAFADERLMGAVDWANVSRSFDGVRATWTRTAWTLDAFGTVLKQHAAVSPSGLDPRRNGGTRADGVLLGVWWASSPVEVFALGESGVREGVRLVKDRYTLGAYLRHRLGHWSATGMGAVQGGRQGADSGLQQTISAYLATITIAYGWRGSPQGSLSAQVDYLSGDASLPDSHYTAFNTLYATNHAYYGSMDLFLKLPEDAGGLGLVDLMVRLSMRPERWTIRTDVHQFELASASSGERTIGRELDLSVGRGVGKLGLQLGYSIFTPSGAASLLAIGLGNDVLHWAYVQATGRF